MTMTSCLGKSYTRNRREPSERVLLRPSDAELPEVRPEYDDFEVYSGVLRSLA